ncbi:uncharacterized protein PHALS_07080 [Plasmopara halstedii]|uniref:Uncharacterized protein n=1 Tax=Plasmopara halstedii TaxID=4781 RepID=A0A0P1B634_PLAHL|nr:uncharacterized protein PHALS_07080 [Plasmopara halstedii]CEG49310.1 hypothetical protein PHALS_07080 [Plasmopara halstedii]|eukprot:XP_024585679.1 hypothetical protein PHALS_07080 [Plasmopara halstedii]
MCASNAGGFDRQRAARPGSLSRERSRNGYITNNLSIMVRAYVKLLFKQSSATPWNYYGKVL